MSGPYYLGWGSPYYEGGPPSTTPTLRENSGVFSIWNDDFALGIDVSSVTLAPGQQVVYTFEYEPADTGPIVTAVHADGAVFLWSGGPYSVGEAMYGIHTITATIDDAPTQNKLVLTVVPAGELPAEYGVASWYAEDVPFNAQFWMRFINSKEVIA